MKTDMLCVVQSKVWPQLGFVSVTWSVDQEFQNFSGWRRWCWNDRWRGRLRGTISWWGWLWETDASGQLVGQDRSQNLTISNTGWSAWGVAFGKTNSVISNDNFSQEGIFDYWNGKLPGYAHVKRTYPDVVRMWRQFHGCPGSGGGIERVFNAAGKQHDALKKALWTRRWKAHWRQEWIPNCRLVMTKESSPMMKTRTGNGSSLRWVGGW